MRKIFLMFLISMIVISSLTLISASSGSIWTTREGCDFPQNENQYDGEDIVFVRGNNFDPGEYDWTIKGLPGEASEDPGQIVADGVYEVGSEEHFCFAAYEIDDDDFGVYKVSFDNKHDNYHVVPEFGTFIGALTILGAVGIFFFVRKQ